MLPLTHSITPPLRTRDKRGRGSERAQRVNGAPERTTLHIALIKFIALGLLSFTGVLYGKTEAVDFKVYGVLNYLFAKSDADLVAGADYSRDYSHPLVIAAGTGVVIYESFYLGGRFERWDAKREFQLGNTFQSDTLKLSTLGVEIGYMTGNPRVFFLWMASIHFPMELSVESSLGTFQASQTNAIYQGRLMLGIRFTSFHSFFVEGGYRLCKIGNLSHNGSPYLQEAGGPDLDLSGIFAGLGIFF